MKASKLRDVLITDGWQQEWPKELNTLWWFHGYRFRRKEEPELLLVEVVGHANNVSYVASGHFLYESDGVEGVFLRCIPPVPAMINFIKD